MTRIVGFLVDCIGRERERDWNGLGSITSFSEKVIRWKASESEVEEISNELNSNKGA